MISLMAVALAAALDPGARFVLHGRVLDSSQAPIAGARVSAVRADQKTGPLTSSDADGTFTLQLLAGRYTVKVDYPGFAPQSQDVTAADSGTDTREFVLGVAGFGETVTVDAPREYEVPAI